MHHFRRTLRSMRPKKIRPKLRRRSPFRRKRSELSRRLAAFLSRFAKDLGRRERLRDCERYLAGLLFRASRRSMRSISRRTGGNARSLDQFINHSPWDHEAILGRLRKEVRDKRPRGVSSLVLDEMVVYKHGDHSVGTANHWSSWSGVASDRRSGIDRPQYRKGQLVLTWNWIDEDTVSPVAARLYLPPEWTGNPGRMAAANIPTDMRVPRERWEAALEVALQARQYLPDAPLVFDIQYGACLPLLAKMEELNIPFLARVPSGGVAGLAPTEVYPNPSRHPLGMKAWEEVGCRYSEWLIVMSETEKLHRLEFPHPEGEPQYLFAKRLELLPRTPEWRRYCRKRWFIVVARESCWDPAWDFYVSNLPNNTSLTTFARLVEDLHITRESQQLLTNALGISHFEGRSWRGLHHHITLGLLACEFMTSLIGDLGAERLNNGFPFK